MSALVLRIIACVAMLIDHMGYYPNNMLMRAIGRIAFPLFVYLICNGFKYTSCRWRYALRLGIFALLSQLPFSLLCTNTFTYTSGNVFVTLLAALLCVWAADLLRQNKITRWFCLVPAIVVSVAYIRGWIRSDYGVRGIIYAMTFYLFDGKAVWKRILTVIGCLVAVLYGPLSDIAVGVLAGRGLSIPTMSLWEMWQLFALLALPFIFLYNGKKGPSPSNKHVAKLTQLGFYLFYPVHILIIWLLHIL